ncbi:hypothetical protein [Staphylococcus phage PT94]
MLEKELLLYLEVNCDYYLSQYTIRQELGLNEEFYNFVDLKELYMKTRLKCVEKFLKNVAIDYEIKLSLNHYSYDNDALYLVINHEGTLIDFTINKEQFINDELELILDKIDSKIGLD